MRVPHVLTIIKNATMHDYTRFLSNVSLIAVLIDWGRIGTPFPATLWWLEHFCSRYVVEQ
jgi:hypothetical protein